MVIGDMNKIKTVVQNLTANARKLRLLLHPFSFKLRIFACSTLTLVKYTNSGSITVSCRAYAENDVLRSSDSTAVEILVADTGCGIGQARLESIFREFEQVESSEPKPKNDGGVGKLYHVHSV